MISATKAFRMLSCKMTYILNKKRKTDRMILRSIMVTMVAKYQKEASVKNQ